MRADVASSLEYKKKKEKKRKQKFSILNFKIFNLVFTLNAQRRSSRRIFGVVIMTLVELWRRQPLTGE